MIWCAAAFADAATVLVDGRSGSGKSPLAEDLHRLWGVMTIESAVASGAPIAAVLSWFVAAT